MLSVQATNSQADYSQLTEVGGAFCNFICNLLVQHGFQVLHIITAFGVPNACNLSFVMPVWMAQHSTFHVLLRFCKAKIYHTMTDFPKS